MALNRGVDSTLLESVSSHFHPIIFVEIDWPGGTLYTHSNTGSITWQGTEWVGVGNFGTIAIPEEESTLVSSEASVALRGQLIDLLEDLEAPVTNRATRIYFGTTTEAGSNTILGEPILIFSGYVDGRDFAQSVSEGKYISSLSLGLSSGPSARAKASINHSVEDSSINFGGDTLMRHTIYLEKELKNPKVWPEP